MEITRTPNYKWTHIVRVWSVHNGMLCSGKKKKKSRTMQFAAILWS